MDSIRQRLIGGALQQTRKLMGNSQAEMGGVLHVSREQVSDYESGKRELRAGDLERLAEWWEIPLPTLMVRLGYKLPTKWPTFEDWLRERENIRQNMQGAGGETPTPDAVLAAEAALKEGRMPYSAGGSHPHAFSYG